MTLHSTSGPTHSNLKLGWKLRTTPPTLKTEIVFDPNPMQEPEDLYIIGVVVCVRGYLPIFDIPTGSPTDCSDGSTKATEEFSAIQLFIMSDFGLGPQDYHHLAIQTLNSNIYMYKYRVTCVYIYKHIQHNHTHTYIYIYIQKIT